MYTKTFIISLFLTGSFLWSCQQNGQVPLSNTQQLTLDYKPSHASKLNTKQINNNNNNVERPEIAKAGLATINELPLGRARAIQARLIRRGAYGQQ